MIAASESSARRQITARLTGSSTSGEVDSRFEGAVYGQPWLTKLHNVEHTHTEVQIGAVGSNCRRSTRVPGLDWQLG